MNNIFTYFKSILLPILIGTIVGLITSGSMKYNTLNKPPLAPPGIAFPIIWSILFGLMGISYGLLKTNNLADEDIDRIYHIQLAINALWSIIFFTLKWRLFAFVWILLLLIAVIIMIDKFYAKNKIAGLLQIPYLLWIIFATYLNLGFYILNKWNNIDKITVLWYITLRFNKEKN